MLTLAAQSGLAEVRWVSPQGDDGGPGTKSRPWRTPHAAAEKAKPGDEVVFRGGLYELDRTVGITFQGAPNRWTVWRAAEGEKPVFDFAKARPERPYGDQGALDLLAAAYVRLRGLRVQNSHYAGIFLQRGCKFIDIQDCETDMTFQPGIGGWNSEDVRIVGNEVTRANEPRMRLFGNPRNECPHEAISIAGVKQFEAAWNRVHSSIKEGIDVKEVSANGIVHHNYVHNLERQAYYADAWFGLLHDVEFVSNIAHDCEWGLVISSEGRNAELKNVTVRNNLLYRNRASGIYFGTWGGDGPRSGIRILHNTLAWNGRNGHWAGATGNLDVRSKAPRDVRIEGNLLVEGGAYQMATFLPPAEPAGFQERSIVAVRNAFQGRFEKTDEPSPYGQVHAWYGDQPWFGEVGFRDAENGDLRLARGPKGYGAFPGGEEILPKVASPLKGFPRYEVRKALFPKRILRLWGID